MNLFISYIFVYYYVLNGVELWESSNEQNQNRVAEVARLINFVNKINDFDKRDASVANKYEDNDEDAENEKINVIQKLLHMGRKFNVLHISNPEVLDTYKQLSEIREERRNLAIEQDSGLPNNSLNNGKEAEIEILKSMELFDLVKPIVKKIMTKYKVKVDPDGREDKDNIRTGSDFENETTNVEKSKETQVKTKSDNIIKEEKQRKRKKKKRNSSNKKDKDKQIVSAGNKHEKRKNKFNDKDEVEVEVKVKVNVSSNPDIINTKNMMKEHTVDWADYDEKQNENKSESETNAKSNKQRNKWGLKTDSENKINKVQKKKKKSSNKQLNSWDKYVDDNLFKGDDNSHEKKNKNKNNDDDDENKLKTRYDVAKYQPDDDIGTDKDSNSEQDSYESFRTLKNKKVDHETDNNQEKIISIDKDDVKKDSWYKIAPNVESFYGKARKHGPMLAFRTSIPYRGKKFVNN